MGVLQKVLVEEGGANDDCWPPFWIEQRGTVQGCVLK